MSALFLQTKDGYCVLCGLPGHSRFWYYLNLPSMLKGKPSSFRTRASLTRTYVAQSHPNLLIGWNQLKREVNSRPAGAAITVAVMTKSGVSRTFSPLPPPISSGKYDGCVIAAFAHYGIIIGPHFDHEEMIAARNTRNPAGGPGNPGGRK
jgi:hypothetical protein